MKNILIVEDEQDIRELLSDFFEMDGWSVICAVDGQDALNLIKNNKDINNILTDINMPNMNGLELIKQLNKLNDREFSIFVMSGYPENDEKILDVNIKRYYKKPIKIKEIISEINKELF